MTRVLLTTMTRPYKHIIPGVHLMDAYTSRFSKHQGIFQFESVTPYMGIYYVANNIQAPAVVLENPTWEGFVEELEHGYDWVGFGFNNYGMNVVLKMCRHIRKTYPNTKIVLGGYGVQGLNEQLRDHPEDAGLFAHACRVDGAVCMRKLLGEDPAAPIDHECPPVTIYPFRLRAGARPLGCMTVSYGCRKHCPFCCAPFHYKSEKPVMSAEEILALTRTYLEKHRGLQFMSLVGEDFLEHRELASGVARGFAADPDLASRAAYAVTSNVLTVSRWDPQDLVRAGVGSVFMCVPSRYDPGRKLSDEETRAVFAGLHDAGIVTTASIVLGQDFHRPENIHEDIAYYVGLDPVTPQVVCYPPAPGTLHWEKMRKEGRIRLKAWEDQHQYAENVVFAHFEEGEVSKLAEHTYRKFFRTWGSSFMCNFRCWLEGYANLRGAADPVLRARARMLEAFCREGYPTLWGHELFAPSPEAALRVAAARKRYREIFGSPGMLQRLASVSVLSVLAYYKWIRYPLGFPVAQPPTVRRAYNGAL